MLEPCLLQPCFHVAGVSDSSLRRWAVRSVAAALGGCSAAIIIIIIMIIIIITKIVIYHHYYDYYDYHYHPYYHYYAHYYYGATNKAPAKSECALGALRSPRGHSGLAQTGSDNGEIILYYTIFRSGANGK